LSENEEIEEVETLSELGDPSVPPELLEIHVDLEVAGMTPEEFADAFGNS